MSACWMIKGMWSSHQVISSLKYATHLNSIYKLGHGVICTPMEHSAMINVKNFRELCGFNVTSVT